MVLADTSVWIRFLANRAPESDELDKLLALDDVIGHELVYGELLIGHRGGRRVARRPLAGPPMFRIIDDRGDRFLPVTIKVD